MDLLFSEAEEFRLRQILLNHAAQCDAFAAMTHTNDSEIEVYRRDGELTKRAAEQGMFVTKESWAVAIAEAREV